MGSLVSRFPSQNSERFRVSLRFQRSAKSPPLSRHLRFAEARSQNQRLSQINGFGDTVVFGPGYSLFIEEVETERVFGCLDLAQQPVAQPRPFLLPHLTFEHGRCRSRNGPTWSGTVLADLVDCLCQRLPSPARGILAHPMGEGKRPRSSRRLNLQSRIGSRETRETRGKPEWE